jgi:hypothetical protein
MPQLLTVQVERPLGRPLRFWIPLLPLLLLFSPLVLLALLAAAVACRIYNVSVPRAFGAGLRIVCALPGTRLDLEQGRRAVLVSIR